MKMEVDRHLSPKFVGKNCFSAPTSPSHLSIFHNNNIFDDLFLAGDDTVAGVGLSSTVPFDWEEKPGTPKSPTRSTNTSGDDFAFDVGQNYESAHLSAEELFDGGVIKPLKPPPRLHIPPPEQHGDNPTTSPIKSSVSSQTRKKSQGALFSPRRKNNQETDPFALAAKTAATQRGPPSRRAARSVSPIRDRRYESWEDRKEEKEEEEKPSHSPFFSPAPSTAYVKRCKKWRLKDFFLFRSASEGRVTDKDPLRKDTADLSNSGSGSGSRRRGQVSAHELHYTANRAVSDDLKKKTFLPYKQRILGRLAVNPAVSSLANGFGFSRKK